MDTSQEREVYNGHVLVLNNYQYKNRPTQINEDVVTKELRKAFEKINFEVTIEENKTADGMFNAVENFKSKDFSSSKCVALVCCSDFHGGNLKGVDDTNCSLKELFHMFDPSQYKNLEGIPKLFLMAIDLSDETNVEIPNFPDYLIGFATSPGMTPTSNPEMTPTYNLEKGKGTTYITTFCDILSGSKGRIDVRQVLNTVHQVIQNSGKQVPICYSRISRELVLGDSYSCSSTNFMLIINNENFLTSKKRLGTDSDAQRLRHVFTKYGFNITEQKDLSSKNDNTQEHKEISEATEQFLNQFELDTKKLGAVEANLTKNRQFYQKIYKFTKEELNEFDNRFQNLGMKVHARKFDRNEEWVKKLAKNVEKVQQWHFLCKHNLRLIKGILKEEEELQNDEIRAEILKGKTYLEEGIEDFKNPYRLPTLEDILKMELPNKMDGRQTEEELIEKLLKEKIWGEEEEEEEEEEEDNEELIKRTKTDQLGGRVLQEPDKKGERKILKEEIDGSPGTVYSLAKLAETEEPTATDEPQKKFVVEKAMEIKERLKSSIIKKLTRDGFREDALPYIVKAYKEEVDKDNFMNSYKINDEEIKVFESNFKIDEESNRILKIHSAEMEEFRASRFQQLGKKEFIERYKLNPEDMEKLKRFITNELSKYNTQPFKEAGCVIVVVMSHGQNGKVLGADEIPVDLEILYKEFSRDNCPDFKGKPKMFLIQACRGDQVDTDSSKPMGSREDREGREVQEEVWLPYLADTITGYSSTPGYVSYRNTMSGSNFIRNVCNVLDQYWKSMDVLSMTTEINSHVVEEIYKYKIDDQVKTKGQMPEFVHSLRKRWMLPIPTKLK